MCIRDSLRNAQAILSTLHSALGQATIVEAGNSHIDAAWLWPRSESIDVVKRTFTTALQLMNEYPDYTYTQSAAQYSAWMADKYPELNAEIKQRIQEGRWEIAVSYTHLVYKRQGCRPLRRRQRRRHHRRHEDRAARRAIRHAEPRFRAMHLASRTETLKS